MGAELRCPEHKQPMVKQNEAEAEVGLHWCGHGCGYAVDAGQNHEHHNLGKFKASQQPKPKAKTTAASPSAMGYATLVPTREILPGEERCRLHGEWHKWVYGGIEIPRLGCSCSAKAQSRARKALQKPV